MIFEVAEVATQFVTEKLVKSLKNTCEGNGFTKNKFFLQVILKNFTKIASYLFLYIYLNFRKG